MVPKLIDVIASGAATLMVESRPVRVAVWLMSRRVSTWTRSGIEQGAAAYVADGTSSTAAARVTPARARRYDGGVILVLLRPGWWAGPRLPPAARSFGYGASVSALVPP